MSQKSLGNRLCHITMYVFITLLLVACAPIPTQRSATTFQEPASLRVEVLPFLSFAPLFIAQDEGYFAAEGLDVEFVRLQDGTAPLASLVRGDIDVASPQIESGLLNAIARGGAIKIVADKGYLAVDKCAAYGLLARKELIETGEVSEPADLKGLRLAIEPLTSEGYYVSKVLKGGQLSLADVDTVDIPPPVLADAMQNGAVDIVHIGEPWITRLLDSGYAAMWMPAKEVIPNFQWAVLAFGPNLLESNRDIGERFMHAYMRAVRQYNQGKTDRNLEIVAANTGLDVSLLERACWPAIRDDGYINIASVLDFQRWGLEMGLLDSSVSEDQFWDASFVEYANAALAASN